MKSDKKRLTALLLCIFLGPFGAHRFYVGRFISGFLMLLSFGGLGIWIFLDLLRIIFGRFRDEEGLKLKTWSDKNPVPKILFSFIFILGSFYFAHSLNLFNINSFKSYKFITNLIKKPLKTNKGTTIRKDKSENIIKYTDNEGITHFVNAEDKIPTKYRRKANTKLDLPPLNVTK